MSTKCAVCGKNLADCETIIAAGLLYCSKICAGKAMNDVQIEHLAEELNPKDIGL